VGSKAFGGLNRRLKEKTAESRWFETTGQAPFGRAKAAYWKINGCAISFLMTIGSPEWLIILLVSEKGFAELKCKTLFFKDVEIRVCCPVE
jgi:hypothetical protein